MAQNQSSNFQTILIVVFIVGAVLGVLIFADIIKVGGGEKTGAAAASGNVVLWGTYPKTAVQALFSDFNQVNKNFSVTYEEKNPNTIDLELVEALASGGGPDLVFMPEDKVLKYRNKLALIPYQSIPERTFRDTFIQEAELYLTPQGITGFPIFIDPIVMYYNLDLLQGAGIAKPPATWEEVTASVPLLTVRDNATNVIKKSTLAMGTFENITHAKDVVSLLMLQAGNPITATNQSAIFSTLRDGNQGASSEGAEKALAFYMSFADPAGSLYSWNRSRVNSRTAFIQGDLALYFGYASELFSIQSQNPNLNFDVAMVPQTKDTQAKVSFGKITALGVLKSSKNLTTAYIAGNTLSSAVFAQKLVALPAVSLPPARRDLLSAHPTGENQAYLSVFFNSALIAKGWLDPDTTATDAIFRDMINNVSSGKLTIDKAVSDAGSTMDLLLFSIPPLSLPVAQP